MKNKDWTTEIPTEDGLYYFYGELYFGSMGLHSKEEYQLKLELNIVEIGNNGKIMIADGGFVYKSGIVGYWQKIPTPELPEFKLNKPKLL